MVANQSMITCDFSLQCVAVLDPPREELPELSEGILSDETMATVTETGKIKMDALCELTAKLQTNPGKPRKNKAKWSLYG